VLMGTARWQKEAAEQAEHERILAEVEHVYPLEQFKEAFEQSLKSNRSGKILFKFGATDGTV
jgi:hypothetical protein